MSATQSAVHLPGSPGPEPAVTQKHHGIARWLDFSRAALPEPQRARMRAHLARCAECRRLLKFCEKLDLVSRGMAAAEVPESLSQMAHAIFPGR